jgi:AraC-like DNA-binding protein
LRFGSDHPLLAGSLLLAPPGSRVRLREGRGVACKSFSFARSLVDTFASESSVETVVSRLSATEPCLARLGLSELAEAKAVFAYLEGATATGGACRPPILRLKVMELLLLLDPGLSGGASEGTGASVSVSPGETPPPRFKAAALMSLIDENYADQFSLGDLATRFKLNPSYLSRAFRAETGCTIVEYLNKVRIRKSCVLLKRSRASVLDIAFAVGYGSLSHFNHYFRRVMGLSPREFRKQSQR